MITNFISNKWSSAVELAAMESSIARMVTGDRYQVDATGTSVIKTARVSDIDIIDYTNDTDLSALQSLSDIGVTINLNLKKAFNLSIDDVDAVQSAGNFRDAAIIQAGMTLGLEADKYAFGLYAGADSGNKVGTLGTPISITSSNVDEHVYTLKEILDAQNAGPTRWLVVPSWFMTKLNLAGLGVQLSDRIKDSIYLDGNIIRFAGFNIVQSNSLTVDSTADATQIMAFTDRALPMVFQVNKVEALRNTKRFSDIVRGLFVAGATVAFPKELATLSAIKGAN